MKVCLINPSSNFNYDYEAMKMRNRYSSGSYNYVHLGLAYIASYLEAHGHEVDILECEKYGITIDDIQNQISRNHYATVGISTVYQNLKNVLTIVKKIKKNNPDTIVYLGGYGATFSCEQILRQSKDIDFCMLGEGESTTLDFIQTLERGGDWRTIKGIAFKSLSGLVITDKRELIDDLDLLPFPKRIYSHEAGVAQIVASRGCYGKCAYCGIQEFLAFNEGKCLRRRSPENVFLEIKQLAEEQHTHYFVFCDPNFVLNGSSGRKWVAVFCKLLKEADFKIKFDVDMRANEVIGNENLLRMLKEVGLTTVLIGIENFSQSELDFMNKRIDAESNVEAVRIIQNLGFKYAPGILLFNPVTTIDDIIYNLKVIKSLDFSKNNTSVKPISFYSAIIASPGLTVYNFIKENGCYSGNEKGYHFIDKNVGLCYELIQQWNQMLGPEILKYRALSDAADEEGLSSLQNKLKSIYCSVYQVDIAVFMYLAEKIKSGLLKEFSDGLNYMNGYGQWISDIREQLNNVYHTFETLWSKM